MSQHAQVDRAEPPQIEFGRPPPHGAFDTVAELAANRCGTAMAIVNIIDGDGIWSSEPGRRQPVSTSIFVRSGAAARDADLSRLADPEVALVSGVPFYAAVPLPAGEGRRLGTIAVIDDAERDIDGETIADLKLLAKVVADSLALRAAAKAEIDARR